jgi:hypothetical protein
MTRANADVRTMSVRRNEPEWVVVLVVAAALIAGWWLKTSIENSTILFSGPEVSLNYPASWLREVSPETATLFSASDIRSGSLYRSHVTVQVNDALPKIPGGAGKLDIDQMTPAITAWSFQRGQELSGFRALGTEPAQVGGAPAAVLQYAYVSDPISSPFGRALPVVVEAADYLVPLGEKTVIVTVAADGMRFDEENSRWFQPILRSVTLVGK